MHQSQKKKKEDESKVFRVNVIITPTIETINKCPESHSKMDRQEGAWYLVHVHLQIVGYRSQA
jgi:hypothetical protein